MDEEKTFDISKVSRQTRRSDLEIDELEILVRLNLAAVAFLAKSYDLETKATYAANVMFFIPNLGSDPFFEHEIWKAVRFKAPWWDTHKENVDGVLLLKKELSAEPSNPFVNNSQEDMAFIASTQQVADKWRDRSCPEVPGPLPMVWRGKDDAAHGFDDIAKIERLNELDFDIPVDVINENQVA